MSDSIFQRVAGWFNGGSKKGAAVSPDMIAWAQGTDVPDGDQGASLVSPYMQSAWVYLAISILAENVAQIPFRISKVGNQAKRVRALLGSSQPDHRAFCRRALGENILESGDAVELFDCPHPTMNRMLFWEQVVSWNALRGEFFILPLDDANQPVDLSDRNPRVRRMLTLTPDLFWHMVVGYDLEGWRYTGSPLLTPIPSEMLSPSEVIHSRTVNPYLYWRGMSPLLVAMLPAKADYAAEMFQKGLLMNNADTGVIATTEQNLTQEQREQMAAALRERKRKAGTPDRPLFLSNGVKIEKPGISNVDMQFLETRKFLRQEIGAIFKVPESMMGFTESKSSSLSGGATAINAEKLLFIDSTIGPLCSRLASEVAPIIRTFGPDLVGWFDIESLPVMQEARRARIDSAAKLWNIGVPFNDLNNAYDLGFPSYRWHNRGYLPFSVQPADQAGSQPGSDVTPGEDLPESGEEAGQTDAFDRASKLFAALAAAPADQLGATLVKSSKAEQLWRKHVAARKAPVNLFQSKVSRVLNEFRGKTLAKLAEVHLEKGVVRKGLIDLIFDSHDFGLTLSSALKGPMKKTLQQAADEMRAEVGIDEPWKFPEKSVVEFLLKREREIQHTGQTVRNQLNTTLEEGVEDGETHEQLTQRIKSTFNRLVNGGEGITTPEARRIAQTEVNIVYNHSRYVAQQDTGIEYKAWLSSHGETVRPGHAAAEEDTIDNPIPLDEPFQVDVGEGPEPMQYPGDDSLGASAGNIINCHCVQIAAQKESEDEKSVTFHLCGLGSITFPKAKHIGIKRHVCCL